MVSHQLEKTFSSYILKRLLNHSTSNDVTAGYVQCDVKDLREPMRMIEEFVLRAASSDVLNAHSNPATPAKYG